MKVGTFVSSPPFWQTIISFAALFFGIVAGAPDASVGLSALWGGVTAFSGIMLAHAYGTRQPRGCTPSMQDAAKLALAGFVIAFVAIAIASVIGWQPMAYVIRAIGLMCAALFVGVFISVLMAPLFGPGTKGNAHDG